MNPPHASHWGGVFERKIGQVRRAMDRTLMHIQDRPLTQEELTTLFAEATAIVNSTPLWATSDDPNDPLPITPNLLLTQKAGESTPIQSLEENDLLQYGPRRWKKIQNLANYFWRNWQDRYLLELQPRKKWSQHKQAVKNDDIVLVRDPESHRNYWPMGKIIKTHPSHDGVIRKVDIRMSRRDLSRPITTLVRPVSQIVVLARAEPDITH